MSIPAEADKIKEAFDRVKRINEDSYEYYQDHLAEIQSEHGGDIVAIHNHSVIKSEEFTGELDDIERFIESIEEEFDEQTVEETYITTVPSPNRKLLF